MLVCSVLTSCIALSKITDSVLRLDVVNLAGFSCDCFFQFTRSTMVNRNGGMEHSILPEAEYLIGTKSLYFFNLKKFFILHCILLLPSIFFFYLNNIRYLLIPKLLSLIPLCKMGLETSLRFCMQYGGP